MTTYHHHTITRTEARLLPDCRTLYAVSGPLFSKTAGERPFLPTIQAAREWIDDQRLGNDLDDLDGRIGI